MSDKKELTNEELEKVTGGFQMVSDPLVNTTVTLKYKSGWITKKISAKVLRVGVYDVAELKNDKAYEVNVDNGYAIGWLHEDWVTGGKVFENKEWIKTVCLTTDIVTTL